jgi:hypothetical protein
MVAFQMCVAYSYDHLQTFRPSRQLKALPGHEAGIALLNQMTHPFRIQQPQLL